VTTVKTCQLQSQASSSSAPSQEPVPDNWEDIDTTMAPTKSQLYDLKALPAALVRGGAESHSYRGKKGKKHKRDRELNVVCGNDGRVPWLKTLKDKSVISVVGTLAPQSLLTTSTTVPTYFGLSFLVNSLDNFTSLAAVYDQYYITLIECQVVPDVSEVTISTSAVGSYVTAVDLDDAAVPTSYSNAASYASSISSNQTVGHYHRWAPQFAVATYSGAFTSYGVSKGWIDCASPSVQHYGLKGCATLGNATQNLVGEIRYHVLFASLH